MGKFREALNRTTSKASDPLSALGDASGMLALMGMPALAPAAGLLKLGSALGKAVSFLTSSERSWAKEEEPDDLLETTFAGVCHEAFLHAAQACLDEAPFYLSLGRDVLESKLTQAFHIVADLEIDLDEGGPASSYAKVFSVYRKELKALVPDPLFENWLDEVEKKASKRVRNRLADGTPIMGRVSSRFGLGVADAVHALKLAAGISDKVANSSFEEAKSGPQGSSLTPDHQLAKAVEFVIENGDPEKALRQLQAAIATKRPELLSSIRFLSGDAGGIDLPAATQRDWVAELFAEAKAAHAKEDILGAKTLWETLLGRLRHHPDGNREDYFARTAANLGLCHWHLGEKARAQELFAQAYAAAPENKRMRFFGALSLHLKGCDDEAKKLAATLTDEPDGRWLNAEIIGRLEGAAAALAYLAQREPVTENDYTVLCFYLNELGRYAEAHKYAAKGMELFPEAHPILHAAALALAMPFVDRKNEERDFLYARNAEEAAAVTEAARLIEKAVKLAKKVTHFLILHDYYANWASFLSLAGEDQRCLEVVVEAEAVGAAKAGLFSNAFLCASRVGNWAKMDELSEKLRALEGEDRRPALRRRLLTAMLRKEPTLAAAVLQESDELATTDEEISFLRLEVMVVHGLLAELLLALTRHGTRFSNPSAVAFYEGEVAFRAEEWRAAEEKFQLAAKSPEFCLRALSRCGMCAYREGRWQEALDYFSRPGLAREYSCFGGEQAHCLLELGRLDECLGLVGHVRRDPSEPPRRLDELAAAVWVRKGQLSNALPLLERICAGGGRAYFWLKRYEILLRLGRHDEAEHVLQEAEQRFPGEADIQTAVSQKHLWKGSAKDAYIAAHKALALAPDSRDAKLAMGRIALLALTQDPLGKEAADEVMRHALELGLLHKVVVPLKDGEPDIPAFLHVLRKQGGAKRRVDSWLIFKQVNQPLTLFANIHGIGIATLWAALTASKGYFVHASVGTRDSQNLARATARRALGGDVVIDAVGLLTCDALDLWDVVPELFRTILVPESVAEAFFNESTQLRPAWLRAFAINQPPRLTGEADLPPEFIDQIAARLQRILGRIGAPPFRRVALSSDEKSRWVRHTKLRQLDLATFAACAVAKRERCPVWADDIVVSGISVGTLKLQSFPTWALLAEAADTRRISGAQRHLKTVRLAELNYRFTPLWMLDVILAYQDHDGSEPKASDERFFAAIRDTDYSGTSASSMLGFVCADLLFRSSSRGQSWSVFAAEQLAAWVAQPQVYVDFCSGAADALEHAPGLYFGLIRTASTRLAAANARLFLKQARLVAMRKIKAPDCTFCHSWHGALLAFEQLSPPANGLPRWWSGLTKVSNG
jgi:tetratricopeptide (TPR) repeat protein